MVLFNYSTKELTAKIVYYGPGLCGKTTNLQYIHQNLPDTVRGKMLSLATKTDRTLFFDFLPIDLGEIRGMKTRVQLYTVPGQVFYNETRKLVLKGADGIVFVADSQKQMLKANAEAFRNLEENLKGHGLTLAEMPHVIQFNKRDLPKLASIEELNDGINKYNAPFYESVATTGIGVQDTLKAVTKLVLLHLTQKYDPKAGAARSARPVAAAAVAVPATPEPPSVPPAGGVPLSDMAPPAAASVSPTPMSADADSGVPSFDMDEIDHLVDEVQETPGPEASLAAEPLAAEPPVEEIPEPIGADDVDSVDEGPAFEIDHEIDPQWELGGDEPDVPQVAAAIDEPPAEIPAPDTAMTVEMQAPPEVLAEAAMASSDDAATAGELGESTVTLTEVAGDDELFSDPSLEVARMVAGQEQEILVPVEVGNAASGVRRFKLSIKLRMDSVD